jgi:hypothetical protein
MTGRSGSVLTANHMKSKWNWKEETIEEIISIMDQAGTAIVSGDVILLRTGASLAGRRSGKEIL